MSVERAAFDVEHSAPRGAVFLSYASQDAAAAKRIADALRAAGVEVWFDQNELVGGDAWDQKIRRQIKDCALFLPIISAGTQARREGYFRLEWKLADDRTHLMARGTPFLVPVCIDDTQDGDALVPDSFMNVQWTRLPGGEASPKFAERVVQLLAGGVPPPISPKPRPASAPASGASASRQPPAKKIPFWLLAVVACVVGACVVVGLTLYFGLRPKPTPAVLPAAPAAPPTAAPVAIAPELPRDPELGRAIRLIYSLHAIAEDFALADDIVKPVLAARPNDPEVVTVAAQIAQEFVTRGFDTSEARRAQTQRLTERAVQLNPESPAALATLGRYLLYVGSQLGRAEELLRRAIAANPGEPRYHRTLFLILAATKSTEEADAFGAHMAVLFPQDPLVSYEIFRRYKDADRVAEMEEWLDKTLALGPVANALVWKAWCQLELHADVAGMKTWLDRVPERERTTTRVVYAFATHAVVTGETAVARQMLEALADTWLADFDFNGPKALLVGQLLQIEGRDELARLQFESALAEIKRAEARDPTDLRPRRAEMWAQIGLGHGADAHDALRFVLQDLPRPFRWSMRFSWWSGPIRACLLLDERAQAIALLKQACAEARGRLMLRNLFRVDPRMARFRDDPEITALLAEPEKTKPESGGPAAAVKADEKSVAVLAFANLSDDKANEYFSDGISEELLDVLAKVPGLKVSARTSAFYFKGRDVPVPEIAQKLGVAYVVEGSVRKQGDKVRITAQLIKAADGFHVWSDKFDRAPQDIFAVQEEIAQTIVIQLRGLLTGDAERSTVVAQVQAAGRGGTKNAEAHEQYLQGRYFIRHFAADKLDRPLPYFRRAVELDPGFALAWADLARVYCTLGGWGRTVAEVDEYFAQARRAADQALALEPKLPEGFLARKTIQMAYDFNWQGARESWERAVALAPADAAVISSGVVLAAALGQTDRALDLARQALALDPANERLRADLDLKQALLAEAAGRWDEAIATHRRLRGILGDEEGFHMGMAGTLLRQGKCREALAEIELVKTEWYRLFAFAQARWGLNDVAASDAALNQLIEKYPEMCGFQIAVVYAYRNQPTLAFSWLERAYRQRDSGLLELKTVSTLQNLKDDPRWPAFLHKLGLADDKLK